MNIGLCDRFTDPTTVPEYAVFENMKKTNWNIMRQMPSNEVRRIELECLTKLYDGIKIHQEQLILNQGSSLLALPRTRVWNFVIYTTLLSPFNIRWYYENESKAR